MDLQLRIFLNIKNHPDIRRPRSVSEVLSMTTDDPTQDTFLIWSQSFARNMQKYISSHIGSIALVMSGVLFLNGLSNLLSRLNFLFFVFCFLFSVFVCLFLFVCLFVFVFVNAQGFPLQNIYICFYQQGVCRAVLDYSLVTSSSSVLI